MKKIIFFFSLIIAAGCSQAQNKGSIQKIPAYRILSADSVYHTQADLKKNLPVMIVYFVPDCGHCQQLMYEIKGQMKDFSKIQIVMVTDAMYKMVKGFYRDFGISQYPNITVGTEQNSYDILNYYGVKMTPYIAIYDRKGNLVKAYDKAPKIKELAEVVKKA